MTETNAAATRAASWNVAQLRERLGALEGRRFWRGLDELADTPEFREMLHREFPERADEWLDPVSRRRFVQLMGASFAFAGLTACTGPSTGKIIPYVKQPEQIVPGRPLYFATAVRLGGVASGVLVESHEGRPTKIEGNPDHPSTLGSSDVFTQASILGLYDPDRSRTVTLHGEIHPHSDFVAAMREAVGLQRPKRGAGLRILTERVTSPTLTAQLEKLLGELPDARWHQWEPVANRDTSRAAALAVLGVDLEPQYRFGEADVVVSLDSDFLTWGAGHVRYARDFGARRTPATPGAGGTAMNRLYVFESMPSATGAVADHRFRVPSSAVAAVATALAAAVGVGPGGVATLPAGIGADTIAAIAKDLKSRGGRAVVVVGDGQPAHVHALGMAMNVALGAAGRTVVFTAPPDGRSEDHAASVAALATDMKADRVEVLVILGGNPVFNAPAELGFADAMDHVRTRVHLSLYTDETSQRCHWHVAAAHDLESWSDARAWDGTVTILQPLIEPLYGGRSAHELIAALGSRPSQAGADIVKEHWKDKLGADFEGAWRRAVHDGFIAGSAFPPASVSIQPGWPAALPAPQPASGLELVLRPDPSVHDGRFANNGWLQELPRPMSKLVWDNAVLLSPATAEKLGVKNEQLVEVRAGDRGVTGPVWIQPGHADDSITVHLGNGRRRAGKVGNKVGFDAYPLRSAATPWIVAGVEVVKARGKHDLVTTQEHHAMEGRQLVRYASLERFERQPDFAEHAEHPVPDISMFPAHEYEGHAWGLAINLSSCIGCNACTIACVAENNIPVVGKEQVRRGREMHWIRVDRYFEGTIDDPQVWHQPVPCMHCENAPCELVCPVAATVHSSEGLNDMAYNRCVGTRYCSNNCPYKVRRFNFLAYSDFKTESLKLGRNPDVTVRSRGVMEKCSYCVQRISAARNDAEREGRAIQDGEILTACQQACPTRAITFGDVNDPASAVSKLKADPRNYGILTHLNTRPRTTYVAAVRNPNPEIGGAFDAGHEGEH